ncbi:MAG: hypothetical protein EOQ42_25860 [Mesorhizobium sp.]|uniref:hypothetical protein n=1 Tax=unclassified Mesorhizobium TaxID=325217 RepID=UPI000FE7B838|nr:MULTISPECIES: hypothetical protein [unclassified Mesorhizobium]RWB29148.1 MAG: hypothetical protein EOQ43_20855 [Mesorhizobium sp.]RWB50863.1 MAG: hypothetical protein EOQ42_25860 [Mesorhizobium sp.]RWC32035.1 MAG: hypothetical protein EOS70_18150 [Mesorhizobium sp.]TGU01050.1 hypothetical protein EN807_15225 [Mesorhizobium sp. M5C.F.Ca.ET.164.01.1.1]TKD48142.1 MAG: hypothetical protein E5W98_02940 [Mesorhizobium sp.]
MGSFFLALHIATAIAIVVLMGNYHFVDPSLMNDVVAGSHSDSLNLASQIGRLDVLTLSITVLSILIAVATILGFWFYRGVVDQRATDEVRERLPMVLDEYVKRNPHLFTEAVRVNAEILRGGLATDPQGADFADDIAKAMEGEPEEGQ